MFRLPTCEGSLFCERMTQNLELEIHLDAGSSEKSTSLKISFVSHILEVHQLSLNNHNMKTATSSRVLTFSTWLLSYSIATVEGFSSAPSHKQLHRRQNDAVLTKLDATSFEEDLALTLKVIMDHQENLANQELLGFQVSLDCQA